MPKIIPLRRNSRFRRLYSKGKSFVLPFCVVYYSRTLRGKEGTLGITATKKLGGAVSRNRAKRLIRAAYRDLPPFCGSFDFVIVARKALLSVKSSDLSAALYTAFRERGIIS